jgi:hypothetical protein
MVQGKELDALIALNHKLTASRGNEGTRYTVAHLYGIWGLQFQIPASVQLTL